MAWRPRSRRTRCSTRSTPSTQPRCGTLSDGTAGREGGWAAGPQPDGKHEFGYLLDPEPLGGPGSAPAPDPKLYATYDGKQGESSGPPLGTETGLAGKIKDALT